uniref:Uncharacterized protein n=1 Tax=viral metagenome TaxID=1070528 RepID=A0A6C0EW96_9ZZZZ
MSSHIKLQKNNNINGESSVASSLNSIVKKQFTNIAEQYNLYASAITEMEEKIKSLKNIMLSESFLNNCKHINLDNKEPVVKSKNIKNKHMGGSSRVGDGVGSVDNVIICDDVVGTDVTEKNENELDNVQPLVLKKVEYFTPSQSNSLFWCFYIIYNGFASYEFESNYFTAEQQFKIQTIEKVKRGENKAALKEHKISKTCFESGLVSAKNINAKTLYALCLCYNLNIFYVYKNTYYEMITNIEKPVHIIIYNAETNNFSIRLPVDMHATETLTEHTEYMEKIKESYWKLDNLEKPLRPITVYSVNDLINICSKLEIPVICDTSNKKKTKAELYSAILQKI